jgi:hypothetical protein
VPLEAYREAFPNVVPPLFESSNSPAPSQTHSITTSDSRQTMELDTSTHMEVDSHLATFEAKVEVQSTVFQRSQTVFVLLEIACVLQV